jgi:hypothetical protein
MAILWAYLALPLAPGLLEILLWSLLADGRGFCERRSMKGDRAL